MMRILSALQAGRGALLGLMLLAAPALAAVSDPAEMLRDPAQEERARQIGRELRCLVCQNQSIEDSDAELARDLRRVVREQVAAGRGNADILRFVHDRYGDFVLLRPRFSWGNAVLWLAPFAVAAGGLAVLLRRGRRQVSAQALSEEEERRLEAVLGDDRNVT